MAFNVNAFKGELSGGGARPSLFEVSITGQGVPDTRFHARASSIPQSTLGTIIVPYFGRQIKMHGNRTFEDWSVTILNDEDFAIRNALETWSHQINSHSGNLNNLGGSKSAYEGTAEVLQYGKDSASPIQTYKFVGIYPIAIAPIDLTWEAEAIEEYQVTFAYDWWEHGEAGVN